MSADVFAALPPSGPEPLVVDVWRGDLVESVHRVHAMVVERDGGIIGQWGEVNAPIYPRSSLKLLQALALIESGAADAYRLTGKEIALASASHNGEREHIVLVERWLKRLGLAEKDLECGPHMPFQDRDQHRMIRAGEKPDDRHNNCSGKHAGMLCVACHLGVKPRGYTDPGHAVQKMIFEIIGEMAEYDMASAPVGIDGCSAPNPALPVRNLALAYLQFLFPDHLPERRRDACLRIQKAMADYPHLVAGRNRLDTAMIDATRGRVLCKVGAEGNYVALAKDPGFVIYLKAEDGNKRAAEAAVGGLLTELGILDKSAQAAVSKFTAPVLRNCRNIDVGKIVLRRA